ncbi:MULTISPECIES: hypothetical protein [unclassified Nostoc]|uniref:hypothetical protein n=1 Tax=unclassified Nostoc TaxID=2593658 RepID=UPI0018C4C74D|nr:hypothetical protein [Nostoc sp. NZL]
MKITRRLLNSSDRLQLPSEAINWLTSFGCDRALRALCAIAHPAVLLHFQLT